MRTFQIEKVSEYQCEAQCPYEYIVFSTSFINPLDDQEMIEEILKNSFSGKILFDLLLKNGFSDNRFIEVEFNGLKFDLNTLKIVEDVDEAIRKLSLFYYQNNDQLLNNSVLSNAHRFLFKKGRIF